MQATVDFTAHVNGADYALRKGDEFEGPARAAAHLRQIGLLAEPEPAAKERKAAKNG